MCPVVGAHPVWKMCPVEHVEDVPSGACGRCAQWSMWKMCPVEHVEDVPSGGCASSVEDVYMPGLLHHMYKTLLDCQLGIANMKKRALQCELAGSEH